MDDDAFAQLVQRLGACAGPIRGNELARAAVAAGKRAGNGIEAHPRKGPGADRAFRFVEHAPKLQAHVGVERGLRRAADILDAFAQPCDGPLRKRELILLDVGERIKCRLAVARARERVGAVAAVIAQPPCFRPRERLNKTQQRAPALHGAAKVVHGLCVGPARIPHRGACLAQTVAKYSAHGLADRGCVRGQGRPVVHW